MEIGALLPDVKETTPVEDRLRLTLLTLRMGLEDNKGQSKP